mmetsp:Transcript_4725/g.11330  ORF Transcript_4725/g.11330 Transcript_4725/m.11330 type:complete len:239 (-) Transcript_4725:107-823(-)
MSTMPCNERADATSSGVFPALSMVDKSPPFSSSSCTTAEWLWYAARCSGVAPSISLADTSALRSSSSRTTGSWPLNAAICSALMPPGPEPSSMFAPAASNLLTAFSRPLNAALKSAGQPAISPAIFPVTFTIFPVSSAILPVSPGFFSDDSDGASSAPIFPVTSTIFPVSPVFFPDDSDGSASAAFFPDGSDGTSSSKPSNAAMCSAVARPDPPRSLTSAPPASNLPASIVRPCFAAV